MQERSARRALGLTALVGSVLGAVLLAACASESRSEDLRLGAARTAIVGGQDDSTHDAVVLLRANYQGGVKECTGTIVKVDAAAHVGYVLTAAHCATWKPTTVLLGASPDDPSTRQFRVLDMTSAAYTGSPGDASHDLAVVRFLGASAATPVIPIAGAGASDGVDVATAVVSVGYGVTTETVPDPAPERRRQVARTLSAVGPTYVKYTQGDGHGVCSGDSGGPVLVGAPGAEKVVAVHSSVDPDCAGTATSMRVSGELAYVEGALGAALPTMTTCAVCAGIAESGDEMCAKRRDACTASAECRAVLDCRGACNSQACADACMDKPGAGLLLAFQACSCQDACKSECSASTGCASLPKCGAPPSAAKDACDACGIASCCAERRTASFDAAAYACVHDRDSAACATARASGSGALQAYESCLGKSCASTCNIAPPAPDPNDPNAKPDASAPMTGPPETPAPTPTSSGCAIAMPMRGERTANDAWLVVGAGIVTLARVRRRRQR